MKEALLHELGMLIGFVLFFGTIAVITIWQIDRFLKKKNKERKCICDMNSKQRMNTNPRRRLEVLTIEEIKEYIRYDFNNEDTLAEAYGLHAEAIIQQLIGNTFSEVVDQFDKIPRPLHYACLMMCGELFLMDSAGVPLSLQQVPEVVVAQLIPYASDGSEGIREKVKTVNQQLQGKLVINRQ